MVSLVIHSSLPKCIPRIHQEVLRVSLILRAEASQAAAEEVCKETDMTRQDLIGSRL